MTSLYYGRGVNTHARLDCEEEDFWICVFMERFKDVLVTEDAEQEANAAIKAYRRAKAGNL